MKIFNDKEKWEDKINFVDINNVFVGFDYSKSCCEYYGYLITKELPENLEYSLEKEIDLEPYVFDQEFFKLKKI